MRTTFVEGIGKSGIPDTVLTPEKPESVEAGMTKGPKRVKQRKDSCLPTLDFGPWTLDLGLWTLDFGQH